MQQVMWCHVSDWLTALFCLLIFLVHPSITEGVATLFSCQPYGYEQIQYMVSYPSVACWLEITYSSLF